MTEKNIHQVGYYLTHSYSWEECTKIDEQFNVEYLLSCGYSWEDVELMTDERLHSASWIEKLRNGTAFNWSGETLDGNEESEQ